MGLKEKTNLKGKRRKAPEIELGKVYRDSISGFEGVCTGFSSFIAGCDQALIAPKVDKDGKHVSGRWFDDMRLIDVEAEKKVKRTSTRGGPQQTPSRTS